MKIKLTQRRKSEMQDYKITFFLWSTFDAEEIKTKIRDALEKIEVTNEFMITGDPIIVKRLGKVR